LVSVFAYNDTSKKLECTCSKDIKGVAIPISKGIVGTSFRTGDVINVAETSRDQRHHPEVDRQVGYTTHNVLSAPIFDRYGRPVGVVQAVNKKIAGSGDGATAATPHFTPRDEVVLRGLGQRLVDLMTGADCLRDCVDTPHPLLVARFVEAATAAETVPQLAGAVRRLVAAAVECDHVGVYTCVAAGGDGGSGAGVDGYFVCENDADGDVKDATTTSGGNGGVGRAVSLRDLPAKIAEALRTGAVTEYSATKDGNGSSGGSGAGAAFMPGVEARHALIYPLKRSVAATAATSRSALTAGPGVTVMPTSVLVIARGSRSTLLPFSVPARQILDLLASVVGVAVDHVVSRQAQDMSHTALEAHTQLVNALLATLDDYIVVMDDEGFLVAWNRDLTRLVGDVDDYVPSRASASSNGMISAPSTPPGAKGHKPRQHIFSFLTAAHCKGLHDDLGRYSTSFTCVCMCMCVV